VGLAAAIPAGPRRELTTVEYASSPVGEACNLPGLGSFVALAVGEQRRSLRSRPDPPPTRMAGTLNGTLTCEELSEYGANQWPTLGTTEQRKCNGH
jgi:hypothetical protein